MYYNEIEADTLAALRNEADRSGDAELVQTIDDAACGAKDAQEIVAEVLEWRIAMQAE